MAELISKLIAWIHIRWPIKTVDERLEQARKEYKQAMKSGEWRQ